MAAVVAFVCTVWKTRIARTHNCSDSAAMPEPHITRLAHLSSELSSYGSLPVKHGKQGRTRAKEFLWRMEALQSRGAMGGGGNRSLVISTPVSPTRTTGCENLRCVEIINGDVLSSRATFQYGAALPV